MVSCGLGECERGTPKKTKEVSTCSGVALPRSQIPGELPSCAVIAQLVWIDLETQGRKNIYDMLKFAL